MKLIALLQKFLLLASVSSAYAQQSSIEEFNITFPPSTEVKVALALIDAVIPAQDNSLKLFKNRYASKLEIKVFACAKFVSKEEIDPKKIEALTVQRNNCLKEQDEQLLQLIGMSLVSFRSMQPPLRPMVKLGSPSFIPNPEGVEVFTGIAASKSGVAVLRYTRGEYVSYEIPSGKQIAHLPVMPNASDHTAVLSPNGRMIVIRNGGLSFIDNETGKELWRAKGFSDFYTWLPEVQAALVSGRIKDDSKFLLLDFKTGEIVPYNIPYKNQSWALPTSEFPSRFLIGSYGDFSLVQNIRTPTGIVSKVIKDYKLAKSSVNSEGPILMQNGKSIFFRSHLGRDNDYFTLFNFKSGGERLFDTGEFLNKNNYAKLSENDILVVSYDRIRESTDIPKPWAFNINSLTLSPIEADEFWGIVSPLDGRSGFMRRDKGMWFGDKVTIGKPVSLASLITARRLENELTVLEKEAHFYENGVTSILKAFEPQIAEKREQLIGNIPKNAKVETISIYQGENNGKNYPTVNVAIKKTDKPIVLMLNSYSYVHWNLIKELGANLVAVIANSYEGSKVIGAGNTKVYVRNNYLNYVSKQDSPEFTVQNNDAFLWTGKPISKLQNAYTGSSFTIGN